MTRTETTLRTRDLRTAGGFVETSCCRVPGCPNGTYDRKPLCATHIMLSPYARAVRAGLEAEERRDRVVKLVRAAHGLKRAV